MNNISPTILIRENNFHNAWAHVIKRIIFEGKDITIGDTTEPKPIRDACVLFELTGDAIKQIESHELHPQFPFKMVDQYCEEFTREFQRKYLNIEDETLKFTYTYFDRLVNRNTIFGRVDQLIELKKDLSKQIETNIISNRNQSITWLPELDIGHNAPPCLQRIWLRYLGNNEVDVHLDWRSRDIFSAWQANLIALVDMLNREVIHPNNCRIVKIADFIDSAHIYKSDIEDAKNVKLVVFNPVFVR